MRQILTFALVLFAAPIAVAAETHFIKIEEKDGKLVIPITQTRYQQVNETVVVNVNGIFEKRTVTRQVAVPVQVQVMLGPEAGDFFDPEGNRIERKKLGDVLKKGGLLAISKDGKPIDPEIMKKNKDVLATLVLNAPADPKDAPAKKDAPADPKVDPKDKPFVTDAWAKDGTIAMIRKETAYQQQQREEKRVLANGATVTYQVTVMVPVIREATVVMDPKALEVQSPDGKPVAADEWPKFLKEKAKVIVSPNGKPVPEEFVKVNKEGKAIILIKVKK